MDKSFKLFLTILFYIQLFQIVSSVKFKKRIFNSEPEVILTNNGLVRGVITDTHRVWYGIPYASPPIGELRLEDPQPVRPWKHIRDCTFKRDQCVQTIGNFSLNNDIGTSEDCLYLDVFVPRTIDKKLKLPVMMSIPGGAFITGSGSYKIYDASHFANSSIIVVNINYRLGALGFLSTDLLSGNFGFMDQIVALEWIRDNIGVFGGNKHNVTIYGQSAGGLSVISHMVSKRSKGLFHRAISSSTRLPFGLKTKSEAKVYAKLFTNNLGCDIDDISCIRSKSVDEIIYAQNSKGLGIGNSILNMFSPWGPIVDCFTISGQPLTMIRDGLTHDVPIIIGELKDEAIIFIFSMFKNNIDIKTYINLVDLLFPKDYIEIVFKYPCILTSDCRPQLSKLLTDYLYRCSSRYHVNKLVQFHKSPVYHYHYIHGLSETVGIYECKGYSCHSDELSLIFNTYFIALGLKLKSDEVQMAHDLNNYWVNFITNNDPNIGITTPSMTTWYPITKTQNLSLILETKVQSKDIISNNEFCNLFDKISYGGYTKPDAKIC